MFLLQVAFGGGLVRLGLVQYAQAGVKVVETVLGGFVEKVGAIVARSWPTAASGGASLVYFDLIDFAK